MKSQYRQYTSKQFDHLAPYFDLLSAIFEGLFIKQWRNRLWQRVEGHHILEVGVGTGKNFDYYPGYARVTGIDFSKNMLLQAERHRLRSNTCVELVQMDIQEGLRFADNSFDTVIATFVLWAVPHPTRALQELRRVCRPGGQVLLLELASQRHLHAVERCVRGCGYTHVRNEGKGLIRLWEASK